MWQQSTSNPEGTTPSTNTKGKCIGVNQNDDRGDYSLLKYMQTIEF